MIEYLKSLEQLGPLGPALTATVGAALVAVLSLVVNTGLQIWKASIDRQIAREKAAADVGLAQRKFDLDVQLTDRKRKADLAEQVLIAVYEARDVFAWVRSRGIFRGEGESRSANHDEPEGLRDQRNTYFIPIERLNREKEVFARLQTLRYAVAAHFGEETAQSLGCLQDARNRIMSAASVLIELTSVDDRAHQSDVLLRNTLGWGPRERPDEIDDLIGQAVTAVETICAPILRADAGQP